LVNLPLHFALGSVRIGVWGDIMSDNNFKEWLGGGCKRFSPKAFSSALYQPKLIKLVRTG